MIDQQKQMQDVEKIVKAGMTLMYDPSMKEQLNAIIQNEPTAELLAQNVVGVIVMLWQKSGKKLPPEAIGPATAMLIYELANFLKESGSEVPHDMVKEAILIAMKLSREFFQKEMGGQQGQAAPQEQPPMPPQAPPQAGMINQQPGM